MRTGSMHRTTFRALNRNTVLLLWCQTFNLQQAKKIQDRYSYISLTSALDWGGLTSRPCPLNPGKRAGTHCTEPQGRSGRVRKISPPSEIRSRTVQPIAISTHSVKLTCSFLYARITSPASSTALHGTVVTICTACNIIKELTQFAH
jgi:hypothetical protein